MTSEECIKIIVDRLISLVDSGQLNATYNQSEDTISFYVNDISIGERPLLTLRVSDHRPTYQKYIRPDVPPPSSGIDTNVSIEFYKPKFDEDGNVYRNRVRNGVSIQHSESVVVPFVINSYSYTPKLLELADVDTIYNAVTKWINGGVDTQYEDPFKGTPKAAIPQSKEAVLKNNNQENKNISCNRNMNKKLIRLTESDLHRIVRESVNSVIKEINVIGKIDNFDRGKGYDKYNGRWMDGGDARRARMKDKENQPSTRTPMRRSFGNPNYVKEREELYSILRKIDGELGLYDNNISVDLSGIGNGNVTFNIHTEDHNEQGDFIDDESVFRRIVDDFCMAIEERGFEVVGEPNFTTDKFAITNPNHRTLNNTHRYYAVVNAKKL